MTETYGSYGCCERICRQSKEDNVLLSNSVPLSLCKFSSVYVILQETQYFYCENIHLSIGQRKQYTQFCRFIDQYQYQPAHLMETFQNLHLFLFFATFEVLPDSWMERQLKPSLFSSSLSLSGCIMVSVLVI